MEAQGLVGLRLQGLRDQKAVQDMDATNIGFKEEAAEEIKADLMSDLRAISLHADDAALFALPSLKFDANYDAYRYTFSQRPGTGVYAAALFSVDDMGPGGDLRDPNERLRHGIDQTERLGKELRQQMAGLLTPPSGRSEFEEQEMNAKDALPFPVAGITALLNLAAPNMFFGSGGALPVAKSALVLHLWSMSATIQGKGIGRIFLSHLKYAVMSSVTRGYLYIADCYLPTLLATDSTWAVAPVPYDPAILAPWRSVFAVHSPHIGFNFQTPHGKKAYFRNTNLVWSRPSLRAYQRFLQSHGYARVTRRAPGRKDDPMPSDYEGYYTWALAFERALVHATGPPDGPAVLPQGDDVSSELVPAYTAELMDLAGARDRGILTTAASADNERALLVRMKNTAAYHEITPGHYNTRYLLHVVVTDTRPRDNDVITMHRQLVAFLVDLVRECGLLLELTFAAPLDAEAFEEWRIFQLADRWDDRRGGDNEGGGFTWPWDHGGFGPAPVFATATAGAAADARRYWWYAAKPKPPSVRLPRDLLSPDLNWTIPSPMTTIDYMRLAADRAADVADTKVDLEPYEAWDDRLARLLSTDKRARDTEGADSESGPPAKAARYQCDACAHPFATLITRNGAHAFCDRACYDDFFF